MYHWWQRRILWSIRMEVRFYNDWNWNDYQGGSGYVSTLPNTDDTPKNPIGFIWEPQEKVIKLDS